MQTKIATLNDIGYITGLRLVALAEMGELSDEEQEDIQKIIKSLTDYVTDNLNKSLYVVLAYADDSLMPVSMINLKLYARLKDEPELPLGRYGDVYGLYTKIGYRNKGYGKAILKRLKDELTDAGLTYFELRELNGESTQIYRKLGFTEARVQYKDRIMQYWYS